ncbi:DUF2309 domain-containing protein [Mycobacterium sp. M26]|uniref:DUF2309 domain-containing protein n=1 Tax=Mycobacterium sp. M26 TaxID=1762962 RepID=UPI00073F416E|nr:DUF2309 domain-containing protein [Mycobacterium sp. M26]
MTTAYLEPGLAKRRSQLRSDITLAARVLPTHYPLETFIAVNPLAGLENLPFEQAVRRAGDLYGMRGTLTEDGFRDLYRTGRITDADLDRVLERRYQNLLAEPGLRFGDRDVTPAELLRGDLLHGTGTPQPTRRYRTNGERFAPEVARIVDAQAAKWCSAFFGSAGWPMPGRDGGFYAAWRGLAAADPTLSRKTRARLRTVAGRADDAVLQALSALGVGDDERAAYLQAHLTRLPGWAAHIQWCAGRGEGIDLMGYLAMRLSYEAVLLAERKNGTPTEPQDERVPAARQRALHLAEVWGVGEVADADLTAAARVLAALPVSSREMVWQNAFEGHYRDGLLAALAEAATVAPSGTPHTQVVTCIDTRSEGLRRHLESLDGYQTFGFAGFFAVAIRFTDLLGGASCDLCPVLIEPNHDIHEVPAPDAADAAARRVSGITGLAGAESAFHAAKDALAAPFTLAEAAGWAAAPLSAAKTLTPSVSGRLRQRLRDLLAPPAPTELNVDDLALEQRALFAQVALTTMGLTRDFGRLVVLCGHGSTTENNPYQASLDCGACGGQAGGPNARTAAAILNQAEVRDELRPLGIDIPDDTWFIAGQHDTATDRVTVLDHHLIPASHRDQVVDLQQALAMAGAALAAERSAVLPGAPREMSPARAARHVVGRSLDWAQVYPEWGLAGNAAFLVGPRGMSQGIDLQRRTFLHSYEAEVDTDGSALETILTAPLVVAQWINCQYYFSTVAPEVFGAGTKTIHNVVGTAGVIAGHEGDLRLGLPWQSVATGQGLTHEPMRLLAVVQAPLERIDMIVARNPILQRLFGNGWVCVAAREEPGQDWQRWTPSGWRSWSENHSTPEVLDKEEMVR